MNREFLEYYNRELSLLYEQSRDFAAEFAPVAERLGGFIQDKMDPGIVGLLEGAAFLAARVQLKIKSEFSEFTSSLLDQLLPNFLAPIASSLLVQATPPYDDPKLREGVTHQTGTYMDAIFVERERRVACRYRLGSDLTTWPLRIEKAEYFTGPAPLNALGLEVLPQTVAGLRLNILHRTISPERDTPNVAPAGAPANLVRCDRLPVQLLGNLMDANAVYEQLFANLKRITLRYEDQHGDPVFVPMRLDQLRQVGFEETDKLYPSDERSFMGFEILRDYFVFPQKYLGFRLEKLLPAISNVTSNSFDLLFEFDSSIPRLAAVVNAGMFGLYTVPAANLFEMPASRIPISRNEYEHQVVPDRTRWFDYETHRVIEVFAHYPGRTEKVEVFPLYSLPTTDIELGDALYFTSRKMPRLPTARERRFGRQSKYVGTETFLSLYEPAGIGEADRVRELSVRILASNRHLTEQLPVGEAGADFRLEADTQLPLRCVAGPTPPRESIIDAERRQREATRPGPMMWKLINLLTFNHLGLTDRTSEDRAGGLKELLALFANLDDTTTDRQIRGIESISTRPLVRRLRQANGFNAARGIEITVTFDEKAFGDSGVMILGAALDRFFAEYSTINSFTETVITTTQRGQIMRWPPRSGLGGLL